ncbi:unnamed protein product, partial [Gulo gulo]
LVSEFVLYGLCTSQHLQHFFFIFFSGIYVATVLGNLIIVVTVISNSHLHSSPMYFLLGNLSFLDIWLASFPTPKMIRDFLSDQKLIFFGGCMAQIFFHFIGGIEMVLLVSMAYDRYVAICKPLHYMTIMSLQMCILLLSGAWAIGLIHLMALLAFVGRLSFCGPNEIDSFYFDLPWFIKLACTDTYRMEFIVTATSEFVSMGIFSLLISYIFILITVWKRPSGSLSKAFSTLTAHITVLLLFFGPYIFVCMWPFPTMSVDMIFSFWTLRLHAF